MDITAGREYDPIYNIGGLLNKPAPQSRVMQRKGRCGRKFTGEFLPTIYTRNIEKLQKQQYSDLIINDVSKIILLTLKQLESRGKTCTNISTDLDLITKPTVDNIHSALDKCYNLGLIQIADGKSGQIKISQMGVIAQKMGVSVPVEICRLIMAGYFWDCSVMDLITIGTWIQMKKEDESNMKIFDKDLHEHLKIKWNKIYEAGLPDFIIKNSPNIDFTILSEIIGRGYIYRWTNTI